MEISRGNVEVGGGKVLQVNGRRICNFPPNRGGAEDADRERVGGIVGGERVLYSKSVEGATFSTFRLVLTVPSECHRNRLLLGICMSGKGP